VLTLDTSADLDHSYTVAFTVDDSAPENISGNTVDRTDTRCAPQQKLEVLVTENGVENWLEYNEDNAETLSYISAFEGSLDDPQFTFQMNKDKYASMFSGTTA
jgi:hypothetical protein